MSENKRKDDSSETTAAQSFMFESDQLAFKGNEDYHVVLSSLSKFEALRTHAMKDLDRLYELRKEAQTDPLDFAKKLQTDPKSLDIPSRPHIPELPDIDWSKYSYTAETASITSSSAHNTRGVKVNVPEELKKKTVNYDELSEDAVLVRGRLKTETKSETFNQLWTSEEQRKLEQLLIEFPPERVESKRFRKIADKLGTKSLQQVCSRIQKYFVQLAKLGLPVPGKVPNLAAHRRKYRNKYKNKVPMPSTFLQAYVAPVYMPDDDDEYDGTFDLASSVHDSISDSDDSDSDLELPADLRDTEEYKELQALREIRQLKLAKINTEHTGYKCDGCGEEPIVGIRYHCTECPQDNSIDFCHMCNQRSITLARHRPGHTMTDVTSAEGDAAHPSSSGDTLGHQSNVTSDSTINDKDYLPSKFNIPGSYNYLDPNYMPST